MWSQEAERKANKFKPEHKTRFIVSNAPELGGQIHPLTHKHVQLINVTTLLKTLDKLTEDPNQQTITSCVGAMRGCNYGNSVNSYASNGCDILTVNSVTNFNRGGVRRAVNALAEGEASNNGAAPDAVATLAATKLTHVINGRMLNEVYRDGKFMGLTNLPKAYASCLFFPTSFSESRATYR